MGDCNIFIGALDIEDFLLKMPLHHIMTEYLTNIYYKHVISSSSSEKKTHRNHTYVKLAQVHAHECIKLIS